MINEQKKFSELKNNVKTKAGFAFNNTKDFIKDEELHHHF